MHPAQLRYITQWSGTLATLCILGACGGATSARLPGESGESTGESGATTVNTQSTPNNGAPTQGATSGDGGNGGTLGGGTSGGGTGSSTGGAGIRAGGSSSGTGGNAPIFDDEFNSLSSAWRVTTSCEPTGKPDPCAQASVDQGALRLSLSSDPDQALRAEQDVVSEQSYRYVRIEVSMQFGHAPDGYGQGELFLGSRLGEPFFHIIGGIGPYHSTLSVAGQDNTYYGYGELTGAADQTKSFHILAIDWTSTGGMHFFWDGVEVQLHEGTLEGRPVTMFVDTPINLWFYVDGRPGPMQGDMLVDWVRVYQKF